MHVNNLKPQTKIARHRKGAKPGIGRDFSINARRAKREAPRLSGFFVRGACGGSCITRRPRAAFHNFRRQFRRHARAAAAAAGANFEGRARTQVAVIARSRYGPARALL